MAYPVTKPTKVNYDDSADNPALARAELATMCDIVGQMIDNAVSTNTANTVVLRDASGNFAAGSVTAELLGNATSAIPYGLSSYNSGYRVSFGVPWTTTTLPSAWLICMRADVTCTGADVLYVNGVSRPIKKVSAAFTVPVNIEIYDINAQQEYLLRYSSYYSCWILLNPKKSLTYSAISGVIGSHTTLSFGIIYQAATDGFLVASCTSPNSVYAQTGPSNPPTEIAIWTGVTSLCLPVKKGDYYVCWLSESGGFESAYFIPLGGS